MLFAFCYLSTATLGRMPRADGCHLCTDWKLLVHLWTVPCLPALQTCAWCLSPYHCSPLHWWHRPSRGRAPAKSQLLHVPMSCHCFLPKCGWWLLQEQLARHGAFRCWEGLEGEEEDLKGLAGGCRQQTGVAACLCSGGLFGNGNLWTATQNLRERSGKTGSCMHITLCGRERPRFSTSESCRLQWPWGNAAINVQTQPVKIFSDLYLQNWLIINSSQN